MESNKQFNTILDECLESLLTGKETVEQCVQRYPQYASQLEPLLRTAVIMNKAVDVKPSDDFRAKARYQLHAMMNQSKSPRRSALVFAPRWAIAVCCALLVFVLSGSTVLAADGSMPGSPLYPVKLATENVRVKLAGSEEKKAEMYAYIADRRVGEMTYMVGNGKTQYLEESAQRLKNYYTMMSELPLDNRSAGVISTVSQSAPASVNPELVPQMTKSVRPSFGTVAPDKGNKVRTVETSTSAVAGGAGSRPGDGSNQHNNTRENDRAKAKDVLGHYAVTHLEELQKLLDSDKVPEAAKPALRRALRASESGYKKALDNLNNY